MAALSSFNPFEAWKKRNTWQALIPVIIILMISLAPVVDPTRMSDAFAGNLKNTDSDSTKESSAKSDRCDAESEDASDHTRNVEKTSSSAKTQNADNMIASLPWHKTVKDSTHASLQQLQDAKEMLISVDNRAPVFISGKLIGHKKELQDCYHRFLKINPKIKGKLIVRLYINCSGLVKEAKIVASELQHVKLEQNLLEIIQSWNDFGFAPDSLGDRVYLQAYEFGEEKTKSSSR